MVKTAGLKSEAAYKGIELNLNTQWCYVAMAVLCFLLYGNTINNNYGFDDHLVTNHNPLIEKGISAIPEIFTTNYISADSLHLDYRPLVKTTFAVEYSLFGWNPHVGHFFNIVLYALACCVLFKLLLLVFEVEDLKTKLGIIIFAGVLLYIAHPIHTEVVASLKNRDEILVLLFTSLSAIVFVKYVSTGNVKYLAAGAGVFLFALLSKVSCLPYIAAIPLMLYFFKPDVKKAVLVLTTLALLTIGYYTLLNLMLPGLNRDFTYEESSLPFIDRASALGTALYALLYYIKLLIMPKPLSFYYGANYIAVQSLFSWQALLSVLLHAGILVAGIFYFKKNKFISFICLFYIIQISIYANIVLPLAGIVAERSLLYASLSFTLAVAFGLGYFLHERGPVKKESITSKITVSYPTVIIFLLIVTGYSFITIQRNREWFDTITLFRADIPHLSNSAKANYTIAKEIKRVYRTDKTMEKDSALVLANQAVNYYKQALNVYPGYAIAAEELGMTYAIDLGMIDSGLLYFKQAVAIDSTLWRSYNNMGNVYMLKKDTLAAINSLEKTLAIQPKSFKAINKLVELYYFTGQKQKAFDMNTRLLELDSESFLPYFNFSQYYLAEKDTAKAVYYLEETVKRRAADKGTYKFLFKYYAEHGDTGRAVYYQDIINRFSPQKR